MARATKAPAPIRFRGTPAALAAVVTDAVDPEGTMSVSVALAGAKRAPVEAMVQTDFDPRILRLTLPQQVPPGVYDGTLLIDGKERPIRLEVDPAPLLHVIPEQLRLEAHPGDLVGADLTMLNQGNVPVTLRRVQAIGIFMSGGIERALRRAYVQKLAKSQRRMDVIADSLAEAHGGLLKMRIERGAGQIAPGEVSELQVVLHVPSELARGSTYGGNWELPGMVYPITVQVPGEPQKDEYEPDEEDEHTSPDEKPDTKPKSRTKPPR